MTGEPSKPPSFALVMPVRNEEASVKATMDAVFDSTRLPDEIVIADGMSTDRTVQLIEAYSGRGVPIKIVPNPTLFAGGGRNAAIRATDAEYILLADFGNRLDRDWIRNMIRAFEDNPGVDMVAGMYKPLVTSDFEHCVACIHYFDDYTLDRYTPTEREKLLPKDLLPGGLSLAITREIWVRSGGFPEWLAKAQDKMFSRKARALGATVAIAWDASVSHHVRSSMGAVFRQTLFYGRGNGQSRFLTMHAIKLAIFYLAVACLMAAGVVHWGFTVAGIVLLGLYAWRAGLRRVIAVDRRLGKIRYLWLAPAALFARDLGVLLGHAGGWFEWVFRPKFRKLFGDYTKGCPQQSFPIIAR